MIYPGRDRYRIQFERIARIGKGAQILSRRGLINPIRLDQVARQVRLTRTYGGVTGAILAAARSRPNDVAVVDERGSLTFRELDDMSTALAHGLTRHGVDANSMVALLARDHRGLVMAMMATGKLGARLLLMNTGFAKPQLTAVSEREGTSILLHDQEFTGLLDDISTRVPRVLTWVDDPLTVEDAATVDGLIADNTTQPLDPPSKPGGLVLLTSGTTGTPKGAPRDKVSPILSAQILDRVDIGRNGAVVVGAPIFHGTGLGIFLLGLALGNKVILMRRFDAVRTLQLIDEHKAQTLVVVPTMLNRILDLGPETIGTYDVSHIRVIYCAGSALSPALCAAAQDTFGNVLHNMYGSTEVAVATIATPEDLREAPGTAGRPVFASKVVLYDKDRNPISTPEVKGTIFVGSDARFAGYTSGGTKEMVDGLMCSNDVGHWDGHGRLFVDGRDDDMIVSGGENVYPLEVENVLASRPDVLDVAVIGVPDAEFGQRLRAFVVSPPGRRPETEEIKTFVKMNLARHKVPRDVVFVDELPRNATGKVVKKALLDY